MNLLESGGKRSATPLSSGSQASRITWRTGGSPPGRKKRRRRFGSYRMEMVKNAGQVALEMGNSPKIVMDHYFDIVEARAAKEYWNIRPVPRTDRKIVTMKMQPEPAYIGEDGKLHDDGLHDEMLDNEKANAFFSKVVKADAIERGLSEAEADRFYGISPGEPTGTGGCNFLHLRKSDL